MVAPIQVGAILLARETQSVKDLVDNPVDQTDSPTRTAK